MKNIVLVIIFFITNSVYGQVDFNSLLGSGNSGLGSGLSNDKIVSGLKEALKNGASKSGQLASATDGFYKNPLIKIPFPSEAKQMEKTLRSIGLGSEVDKFIKSLNRAAEDASKKAAPIFIDAITGMDVNDGLKILRGSNTAATEYLKGATSAELKTAFNPVIKNSLKKVNVTKYWKSLAKSYNQMPMVKKMNPDLEDYVSEKTLEGLFKMIAEQEAGIRKDPLKTGSKLIEDVFGGKK